MTTSPEDMIASFEARARRVETPCGNGAMAWRTWGQGAPLVLLHGAQGAWMHWIRNIDALAADRRIWAADLPGYGESAMPSRPHECESVAEPIAAGIEKLIPGGAPVDVVGFSMGGVIGAHLAAIAPHLVRRLIIVDSGGLGTPMGKIATSRVRGLEGEALRQVHRANLLGLMLHHPESADELALHIQMRNVALARLKAGPLVLPDKLIAALPRVQAQVDAIWGEHDRAHPPEGQLAALRSVKPAATLQVIEDAGHWSPYERAARFNTVLRAMLETPLTADARG